MNNKDKIKLELEDYFFEIIDQSTNGITISDPNKEDNPLIYVNKAFTDIFGYSFDESVGKNCRFLQKNDKNQGNLQKIRDAIKQQKQTLTVLRNYTKDGRLIYNEIKVSPIFDKKTKKLKYFLGIQKDITKTSFSEEDKKSLLTDGITSKLLNKHKNIQEHSDIDTLLQELNVYQTELLAQNDELIQKEKSLTLLNEEFSSLFLSAPIAYLLIDKNLEIKRYNYLANKYLGIAVSKVSIKSLFFYVKKDNIEKLISWVSNKDYIKFDIEIDVLCKGEVRRFKFSAKKYLIDNSLLMLSLVDIQEEYEIKNYLEKKVQEEVQKRVKQEKFMQKQAKLASMGEMIDVIAHQWLNPLTTISLYAQNSSYTLNEMENKNEELDIILKDLNSIDRQTKHLATTLYEFRDFFRPDKESRYISMKVLIDSSLVLVKDELVKNGIEVEIDYDKDFQIKVIENQFKHVIINLITNSRDAFIENDIENRFIIFRFKQDEKNYILEYQDNAGGIKEQNISRVFEMNFTTKSSTKGTGIGLYLCEQIVRKFNSTIEVQNVNKGACFSIKFPKLSF